MKKRLLMILILILIWPMSVKGDATIIIEETEEETYYGVVQVMWGVQFDDGSFDPWLSLPGVAVGERTVITRKMSTDPGADNYADIRSERKNGYQDLGIDIDGLTELSCMIYDGNGYLIKGAASGTEFTYIQTEEDLREYAVVSQRKSSNGTATACGYLNDLMDLAHYAEKTDLISQQVTYKIDMGKVTVSGISGNDYIAIYNTNKEMIGLLISPDEAISAERIMDILDAEGISYVKGVAQEEISTSGLEGAIREAEEKNGNYTEESKENLDAAVERGRELLRGEPSQKEINEAASDIRKAIQNLEKPKSGLSASTISLLILIGILILITGFILFRLITVDGMAESIASNGFMAVFKKPERYYFEESDPEEKHVSEPEQPLRKKRIAVSYRDFSQTEDFTQELITEMKVEPPGPEDKTADLHPGVRAGLMRELNGELVYIDKFPFTIGKDPDSVYQIHHNDSVSRNHCRIVCLKGEYSIIDDKSTNGTYVNGYKITPMTPFPIENGSKIIISNETFEFFIELDTTRNPLCFS